LNSQPRERWLRYFGPSGGWPSLSYRLALSQPANFFRNKIVFIGNQPGTSIPGDESDEFRTPYTRWTGDAMAGVQIMITSFVNLVDGNWLRRPPWWIELLIVTGAGAFLGVSLGSARPWQAILLASAIAIITAIAAISASHFTNIWFPWLVIAGGEVPCALMFGLVAQGVTSLKEARRTAAIPLAAAQATKQPVLVPDTPDYQLLHPPFGEGAYGKVWLARNAIGQWQALKVIYLSHFDDDPEPYDREFNGIKRYKPLSDKHPGLLRVDFVSQKKPDGYFFYVMELGDPLAAGWEQKPSTYRPRDLFSLQSQKGGQKVPVRECLRIGAALADATDFLHQHGLTHRDIKPQNVLFVNGRPKLADMGLIAEIRPIDQKRTYVGTPGYMPPPPELPGTPQADIYALGMMLYVIATGRKPSYFPQISASLAANALPDFLPLNDVILRACEPRSAERYASAAQMRDALLEAELMLGKRRVQNVPTVS
jgi:hypothetical protein